MRLSHFPVKPLCLVSHPPTNPFCTYLFLSVDIQVCVWMSHVYIAVVFGFQNRIVHMTNNLE